MMLLRSIPKRSVGREQSLHLETTVRRNDVFQAAN